MATDKQVAANRLNGLKGGPRTPEGKAVVRLNARTHGIFAQALTFYDVEQAAGIYTRLARWLRPIGEGEEGMVEKLALIELRTLRCAEAEGEYFSYAWNGCHEMGEVRKRGMVAWFNPEVYERLVRLFERYAQSLDKQYWRTLHEIRAEQKRRREEKEQEEDVVFVEVEDEPEEELAGVGQPPAPAGKPPAVRHRQAPSPGAKQTQFVRTCSLEMR
jgi:hypothetical protein